MMSITWFLNTYQFKKLARLAWRRTNILRPSSRPNTAGSLICCYQCQYARLKRLRSTYAALYYNTSTTVLYVNNICFQHFCRQTLTRIKTAMEANWSNYNLAMHGLGPEMLKGAFALIDACLVEAENLHCLQE